MAALSGGQAARAGLASLLLSRYDVFLLDEPTNDLDLDGLERLERFVSRLRAGAVLVSHDREFLARTVTRVVELDLAQHAGQRLRRRLRRVPRGARDQAAARARGVRGVRRHAGIARGARADAAAWMEKGVRNARRKAHRQRQARPQVPRRVDREAGREGEADRAHASSG